MKVRGSLLLAIAFAASMSVWAPMHRARHGIDTSGRRTPRAFSAALPCGQGSCGHHSAPDTGDSSEPAPHDGASCPVCHLAMTPAEIPCFTLPVFASIPVSILAPIPGVQSPGVGVLFAHCPPTGPPA